MFGGVVGKVTTPFTELYTPIPRMTLVTVTLPVGNPGVSFNVTVTLVAVELGVVLMLVKLTVPVTVVPAGALDGKPAKLALMSAALAATLNVAVLLPVTVSLIAPVVPVPATPVEVCKKLIEALTVDPGATVAKVEVLNVTCPLTGLYVPLPSRALVTVTLAAFRPIGNCNANVADVAVALAAVLMFTKLAVPLTTVLTGALDGKPAKLALILAGALATVPITLLLVWPLLVVPAGMLTFSVLV